MNKRLSPEEKRLEAERRAAFAIKEVKQEYAFGLTTTMSDMIARCVTLDESGDYKLTRGNRMKVISLLNKSSIPIC